MASILANGSFETPALSTAYGAAYGPIGAPWTALAGDSGTATADPDRTHGYPDPADGSQSGFLGPGGSIAQSVDFGAGGTFRLAGYLGFGSIGDHPSVSIEVAGQAVATIAVATAEFSPFGPITFTAPAGVQTLSFANAGGGGGGYLFLDGLDLEAANPPTTIARPKGFVPPRVRPKGRPFGRR